MQRIEWLDPIVSPHRDKEFERYASARMGAFPPYAKYLCACPWIFRADMDFDIGGVYLGRMSDLVYLIVSRDNSCRFCYGAIRVYMRLHGMSESQIDKLEEDVDLATGDVRSGRALEFARKLSRCKPPPGKKDRDELLKLGYTDLAIDELALWAGIVVFHNRFGSLLALPAELGERLARSPFARLTKFLFRRNYAASYTPGEYKVQGAAMAVGPFSSLTSRLDGFPHAIALRGVIDDAWASPHITPRCRALIIAVIARGLGAGACERDARQLAADEGLSPEAIEHILATLASSELTEQERLILPYARETISYQPAAIQKLGRDLKQRIGNDAFLDTVGTAALGNLLARVTLALDIT